MMPGGYFLMTVAPSRAAFHVLHSFIAFARRLFLVNSLEQNASAQIVGPHFAGAIGHQTAPVVREVRGAQHRGQHCHQPQQHCATEHIRQRRIVIARRTPPAIPLAQPRRLFEGTKHKYRIDDS